MNPKEYKYRYISAAGSYLVATGRGKLHSIVVNTTAADTIIASNSLTTTSPTIATLKADVPEGTYLYDVVFSIGLFITTAADSDITVTYSQP